MCFIGGSRHLWGPLIGAVLYTLTVNFWLQSNRAATLITGGIFVVVMLVIPNGLLSLPSRLPIHLITRRLRQPR
jgi:ABC-type branched-subunit amino acid transport system permease subunit